jgi:hypothetical protein
MRVTLLCLIGLLVAGPVAAEEAIPREALVWQRTLIREVRYYWGMRQSPAPFFGQVHQESRWKATARSAFASGMSQFTPPTAEWIQRLYAADLQDFCAERGGCPSDPRWALRALVLYDRRLWQGQADTDAADRLAFALVGYNGGAGWVARERRRCQTLSACTSTRWFGQVELVCVRGPAACRESREYPRLILLRWRPLYESWLRR